jgi:secreted trypsin-like serine protease
MKAVILVLCVSLIWVQAAQIKSRRNGGRIVGGEVAMPGQFRFAAAIYIVTADSTYFCAGSLIMLQWILTAGQCVDGALLFNIRLGNTKLSTDDPNMLLLATETYFLHPDYDPLTLRNDIGLIKLRMQVFFTDYIGPTSVLKNGHIEDGASVLTVGWGQTSDEVAGLSDDLRYANLVTLTHEECLAAFGTQVNEDMLCVAGNYNEGTCRGDLGSPLVEYVGPLIFAVGVSSFISSNGCESPDPSGYTRTRPYFEWIMNTTRSN